jgi:glycine cleavage system H protein
MQIPENLRYTAEHEWVEDTGGGKIRVGITDYAQDALGDVVFVQLPTVGQELAEHGLLAEVESTKSVAEVYAPAAGRVTAVNSELAEKPELINQDPYGGGWFCEIEVTGGANLKGMLDPDGYRKLTE